MTDLRRVAVALAGFCAFVNLYAPQAVLPLMAREFQASAVKVSTALTASTLAVALIAPFSGAAADVLGRKRVIAVAMAVLVVPTAMVALAPDLPSLIFWRFVQGLALPPIFVVTVAYMGEEWPASQVVGVTGTYLSATSFGGFFGRFITGVVADLADWRRAFLALAALTAVQAIGVALLLPKERRFVRSAGIIAAVRQMFGHLRNARLVATYAIGFGVLFTFMSIFTYISFYLAAPPFDLSPTLLGTLFVVYLAGAAVTPLTGRLVARFGRRPLSIGVIAVWIGGLLLSLVPSIAVIVVGLTVCAAAGFLCQALSTSFVAVTARTGASSAVGLYVSSYYVGGSAGSLLPGLAWNAAGWPGCVALTAAVLLAMAATVWFWWGEPPGRR
ncbi:MAG TPA: MFS transporter [Xanthobacteraceae bacterium]|nr:MFS transporter [Xanthobacteraceae bacterium]